ncbi:MAG: hypothetical protein AAFW97_14585 [Pseudomonadota bacterium]
MVENPKWQDVEALCVKQITDGLASLEATENNGECVRGRIETARAILSLADRDSKTNVFLEDIANIFGGPRYGDGGSIS